MVMLVESLVFPQKPPFPLDMEQDGHSMQSQWL